MTYIKRDKLVPNPSLCEELLQTLLDNGAKSIKAKQLVYYPTPMSLIRWSKWLNVEQMGRYLITLDDYKEMISSVENDDDLGI